MKFIWENEGSSGSTPLSHPSPIPYRLHILFSASSSLSQLSQVDRQLAVARTMRSSQRNFSLKGTEWKWVSSDEKGKKKKLQLTAARCIGAPHSQSHSRQECRTQTDTPRKNQPIKPHFDLNTQQSHILTLPDPRRASCFVFPDTDNTAHQEVDTYNTQWRTQGGKTMMFYT